jgi:hypothetical protein
MGSRISTPIEEYKATFKMESYHGIAKVLHFVYVAL